jgi:3,5-epimerase/4-reductase
VLFDVCLRCAFFDRYNPTHVINAAGVTGVPNVDWCESNQEKALRSNIIGTMNVSDLCAAYNIHCTLYATGCIFEYDEAHKIGGVGFTEEDKANFDGSFYSKTKVGRGVATRQDVCAAPASLPRSCSVCWDLSPQGFLEEMLKSYKTTLVLRLRMPISDDLAVSLVGWMGLQRHS